MSIIFWITFTLIVLHYFLYAIIIVIFTKLYKNEGDFDKEQIQNAELSYRPTVSFIIAAFNEEDIICEKIENCNNIEYPSDKIEFIIVSDGSTDNTSSIVSKATGITGLHQDKRQGKTAALNRAIAQASGEIIIFSDANSMFKPNAIKKLIRNFINKDIGGVCGRKFVISDKSRAAGAGDNLFWHYESFLKSVESRLGSIPTADGEIFAIRKSIYKTVPKEIINDDMAITFNIIEQGFRVIYDKEAITEEEASITHKDDYNVKARMVYGGLQIINIYKSILNPVKSFYALRFFIHKTLRYFMWLLLLTIYLSNAILIEETIFYSLFFILQNIFYALAIGGYIASFTNKKSKILYFPFYYCNVNLAAFNGFIFFIKQSSGVSIWSKAQR